MAFRFLKRLISARAGSARPVETALFEGLEQRLALYADPFLGGTMPSLSAMKNTNDTVVRFQTTQGFIDIELYDKGGPPAAVTAANFLNYVNSGRYDNTFFHRMISGFVLQGGGFVDDPTSSPQYSAVTSDAAIVNEYSDSRKNVARTVAMAKLGGNPNSATCQFFFNLVDNPDLDTQNGGFTVFGKVIGGWDIVTTIADFTTRDLNTFLGGDAFGQVPLSGPANTDLVRIIDAEVIKAPNQTEFYNQTIYFPEGFRSGRIVSSVDLVNENAGASALYQIIGRYETKTRDVVISSGTLVAGAHLDFTVSKAGTPSLNLVKAGTPFAYIVRSTSKVSGTLIHKDFNATASESFFQAEPFDAALLKKWNFAGAQKGPGISSYVVWENTASVVNTVTVSFFSDSGTTVTLSKIMQPYRRGGLDLSQIAGLPDGLISIRVTSAEPIVAVLSQYRAAPSRASMELGVIGDGNVEGILPGAYISSSGQTVISATRTGANITTAVTIDFQFILSDGSIFSNNGTLTLGTNVRFRRWDVSTLNGALPRDEYFTIRYKVRSSAEPIAVSYFSLAAGSDAVEAAFQTFSSKELQFAGGFTDGSTGAQGQETISIFNPYAATGIGVTYHLKFHFVDGTSEEIITPAGGTGSLAANHRIDIAVRNLTEVMQRVNSDARYRSYSVSVTADIVSGATAQDGAIFAQLTRLDPAGNSATIGPTLTSGVRAFFADDSSFGAP